MNAMIKSAYLLSAALLMLAACSQEEPITGPDHGGRIIFRTSLPEVISRAEVVSKENIHAFHVTAFNPATMTDDSPEPFINNVELKMDENSGFYSSADCQWPEKEHESDIIQFFAYYPGLPSSAELANGSTVSEGTSNLDYKIKNYTIAADISEQVDFITAYTTGSMEENMFSGINLEFQHKLSRIEVKAKSSNKSCKLEIAGVRIGELYMQGTYNFKAEEEAGDWTIDQNQEKKNVEYIFSPGDEIVALDGDTSDGTTDAVSIMGGSDGINYAMLLPHTYSASWDFANDHTNSNKGMFISVLLRVLDKTPNGNDKQQYPYYDNSQGLNAMNIPRVVLAVDNDGKITANYGQLYKGDNGKYYTDAAKTTEYTCTAPEGSSVKEFGWAALPVTGNWEAGYAYIYTLDYSYGVGLHDPSVKDPQSGSAGAFPGPKAGDPIISDRVGVTVTVKDWQGGKNTTHKFDVPGS